MKGNHETSRSAEVTLDGQTYLVDYTISGSCYYDPGRISGPPEDCYPPDGGVEDYEIKIDWKIKIDWTGGDDGLPIIEDAPSDDKLIAEIEKLSPADFLMESWLEQGPDDEPDYPDDEG